MGYIRFAQEESPFEIHVSQYQRYILHVSGLLREKLTNNIYSRLRALIYLILLRCGELFLRMFAIAIALSVCTEVDIRTIIVIYSTREFGVKNVCFKKLRAGEASEKKRYFMRTVFLH